MDGKNELSILFTGSKSFYLQELFPEYEDAGTLPDDVIEITRETYEQFLGLHPEGKEIGADSSGRPVWINSPPPSKEDEVLTAEMKKISLVSEVNTYINTHQWPGKAAIGRLKSEELAQYNLWLDYLDALELVDTSSAPDIEWPTPPAVQAR
ncbi:tail fiber assembly protein [Escherichia coli]|uniref:tail fiber assembly protein n=11 Tax=Escherichia coli TaxID=562 RepID=UPI0011250BBC|nr:tail fiber assembly protein [Escherichia coli]